jgi:hypothetical protein
MEMAFNNIVPESKNYTHDEEDDMPAHVKSSLLGSSVPISNGRRARHLAGPFGFVNIVISPLLAPSLQQ